MAGNNSLVWTKAGQQSDCPLFTTRTDWAYDWSVPAGVATQFVFNQSATNPDAATETTAGGILRKRTKTQWEQPCGGGSIGNWTYQYNPRAAESNIYDNTNSHPNTWENRRRITLSYAAPVTTDFNLVSDVYEYDINATTVLRRTHTDYNQTTTYTSRRIIGLPTATFLYDGSNALQSKVNYLYDESGYLQTTTSGTLTQHDTSNYGVTFLAGRGNQTTVRRYDVTNQSYVEWKTGYNTTGSPIFSRDPRYGTTGAQTTISYEDKWVNVAGSDTADRNTFAYPTTVTDPDNYSSTIKYNFELGAVRFTTNPKGAVTMSEYDGYGRLWKMTSGYGSASPFYTALSFDSSQNWVSSLSSIESGQPDFYSITTFDGHGRVRGTVSDHPGSAGQYKGMYRGYDTMGRQTQVSNPTEINSSWNPTGDDAAGWAWSFQAYDWQGRPTITRHQNHTTNAPRESEISYEGCGCAGSQVVTSYDEGLIDNVDPNLRQRRKQQVHYDILGRPFKTQTFEWNGNVHSTTVNVYNARDQITSVKEYSGTATGTEACPSATCQKTTMSYDGHGRLSQRQLPIENAPTTYTYDSDDKVLTMEDARHAKTIYGYGAFSNPSSANNRRLLSSISYDLTNVTPSGSVAATPNVTFGYDQAGNRMWMDDGPGRVDYTYDSLSRLQTEARQFDGLTGSYQFTYAYNLAGQVNTITDNRFNTALTYNYDKAGQLTNLTGTGFEGSGQTNFTSTMIPIKYRAWGGIKEVNYGDNLKSNFTFDSRLKPTSYRLLNTQSQVKDGSDYEYYPDGRIKFASNLVATNSLITPANAFDRAYKYDNVGRLMEASTGPEARGETLPPSPPPPNNPYKQTNTYDAWGNLANRTNRFWRMYPNDSATYVNNRRQYWQYDQAGNVLVDTSTHAYDATSRQVSVTNGLYVVGGGETGHNQMPAIEVTQSYDGDGLPAKRVETKRTEEFIVQGQPQTNITTTVTTVYQVRSRIHGGNEMLEVDAQGNWVKGFVYAGGVQIAENIAAYSGGPHDVIWRHSNPVTGTLLKAFSSGPSDRTELDPFGAEVGNTDPYYGDEIPTYLEMKGSDPLYIEGGDPFDLSGGCTLDGMPVSCNFVAPLANSGVAARGPEQTTRFRNGRYEFFQAFADGKQGWLAAGAIYGTASGFTIYSGDGDDPNEAQKHILAASLPDFVESHQHNWRPWVVPNVKGLEKTILAGNSSGNPWNGHTTPGTKGADGQEIRYCATLPQKWSHDGGIPIRRLRYPEKGIWQMGSALTPETAKNLKRGTVIATFSRRKENPLSGGLGLYENNPGGNHTAIFLSYGQERAGNTTANLVWVIEQGPGFRPRGRKVYFSGSGDYFNDAYMYNVVNICGTPHAP